MTRWWLLPAVPLYAAGLAVHRRVTRRRVLPRPVISVGNITWGGTGKTPVVIYLARRLAAQGRRPAVLTRGYFRQAAAPVIASDGKHLLCTPAIAGDEPCLIAERAPGAAVLVSADRYAAGMTAMERFDPGVFILDDGFQQWKLARACDIVCVNALNPWGNGCLIPAGSLREPVTALSRASCVLITNAGLVPGEVVAALEQQIRGVTGAVIAQAGYAAPEIRNIMTGVSVPAACFPEREVVAVSAIGENRGFYRTLEQQKFSISRHIAFRDHYWYNLADIPSILSGFSKTTPVLTTAKDAVKLKPVLARLGTCDAERFYSVDVALQFLKGEDACLERMEKAVRSSLTVTER
jgi:tetraacyldisaccharide 4'-kinase